MYILRVHLLPRLYHRLVLDKVTKGLLRSLDWSVRSAIRDWLHLPKDVPIAAFHAKPESGGYGIPSLSAKIPLMRRNRIEGMVKHSQALQDPVLRWFVENSPTIGSERERWGSLTYDRRPVNSKADIDEIMAKDLHSKVDGAGLRHGSKVKEIHRWVTNGSRLQTGRGYVRSLQVRSGCVYTAGRASRGRKGADPKCDTCGVYESISHILQVCGRTWAMRNARHDYIVQLFARELEKVGCEVKVEPRIPTRAGIRKPDLIVIRGIDVLVTDVTIVSDDADLDHVHDLKAKYYDLPEIRKYVAELVDNPSLTVEFSGLAFNWRGAMSRKSFGDIRRVGLPVTAIELAAVAVLEKGYDVYRHHRRTTGRGPYKGPHEGA